MVKLMKDAAAGADPILTRAVEEDKVSWYKKKNLRYLYLVLFPTCMGIEITSGFDSQMINAVQIVEEWQTYFGNPSDHYSLNGIIAAAYSLGAILSLPFVPWFAQRFGRRWSIMAGSCIMIFGAAIQAASQHVAMYIIARMILGFGIPACIVSGSALLGELGYPKERPILTSLFNASYFVGSIVAAGITFGTMSMTGSNWSWRTPSLLQAVPSLLQVSLIFLVPESPRWLISRDRREEAYEILVKYHGEGDRNSPIVAAEFAQMETTLKLELENAKLSWTDILRTSGNRKRILIASLLGLFTQWSGNTLISYYLSTILEQIGYTDPNVQAKINLGNTAWNLINAVFFAMIVRRFPRRKMYLACACSLLCCYVGWTISNARYAITGSLAAGKLVIFFIYLYSPCYNIGYNALTYTFLVELFPYATRSRGITIFQLFGRCAGFFSTFVNPIGMGNAGWKYLIMYCVWLGFEIICIYTLWPETYGRTLEELTFLFEDKELQEKQSMATEKQLFGGDVASVTDVKSATGGDKGETTETVETKA